MSYNYNKNKKGHKATTADTFRGSSQEVKLTGNNVTMPGDKTARSGYVLAGWAQDPKAKTPELGGTASTLASNTTYYAIWKSVTGNSDLANVITGDGMFTNDSNIEGSQGTIYNSLHDGLDYAHPDGGIDNPGYYSEE